jgi:hypothetical protein
VSSELETLKIKYDAMAAENEKLKKDNLLALDIAERFANERDELRAANAELVEALKAYSGKSVWTEQTGDEYIADQALAKHGGDGK